MEKFFTLDEDFKEIIQNSLVGKEIKNMNFISTGWTNIVYEVETNDGDYFFRFPRDDFWIRTIVKDCEFAKYIDGKTSFKTVKLKKMTDNQRPYSVHKKIAGVPLAEKLNKMTPDEMNVIAEEIAKFMYELHSVKFDKKDIFRTEDIGLNLVDFLDELIEKHLNKEDKVFWKYNEFTKKENSCLVHGDLNLSNILIDDNNNITGVIDFGFAGYGNKYFDIARILSRDCPKEFKEQIIKKYEEISGAELDRDVLETEIKLWKDIDSGYIKYMKGIGIYK